MKKLLIIINDELSSKKRALKVDGKKYKISIEEPLKIETEKENIEIKSINPFFKKEIILKENNTAVLTITLKAIFLDISLEYLNKNIDELYREQLIKYLNNNKKVLNTFDKTLSSGISSQKFLIDSKNKLWKINDKSNKKNTSRVYKFEDIKYCEFRLADKIKTMGGDVSKALLGDGFFGNLLSTRDITDLYNHCIIRIYLKNQTIPFEEIRFYFFNKYTEAEAYKSKTYLKAKDLYNKFKEMTNSSEKEEKSKNKIDTKKLLEIKELLDANVITKEEFDKIKKDILGG